MGQAGRVAEPPASGISPELLHVVAARAGRPDYPRFAAQLRSSGHCARPVRLRGHVETPDQEGARRVVWSTQGEPDGVLRKACGNRREAVCGPCAERYRGDAYHLISAGLRGGKGVPESVMQHPAVFVTLTAPSFGPVHGRPLGPDGQPRRCRPRRDAETCPHGVRLSCARVHDQDDPRLGEPLCPGCFDYRGALVWNNLLGELWRRTGSIYLPRILARQVGVTQKRLREQVRVAYVKVAEYQRRGLVHLHVLMRLDRAMPDYRSDQLRAPDDPRFTTGLLEDAIRETVAQVSAPVPPELGGGRVRWGDQLDVRPLDAAQRREIAGYLAKYATKSTEQAGGLLHRITREDVDTAPVREHVRSYLREAFTLDTAARAHATAHPIPGTPVGPPAETAHDPNALARRVRRAMSADEHVSVRLRNQAGEHVGRIQTFAAAGTPPSLTLDTGDTIELADVTVIATATHTPDGRRRDASDRRLGACAHAFGYRGHCLTQSRRYSTTFKALRQAREDHVRDRLARSDDESQRALAETAPDDRIASFSFAGSGHLTTADAFLAASAAARAREERQAAREAVATGVIGQHTMRREEGCRSTVLD